jgi:hypothetical protein
MMRACSFAGRVLSFAFVVATCLLTATPGFAQPKTPPDAAGVTTGRAKIGALQDQGLARELAARLTKSPRLGSLLQDTPVSFDGGLLAPTNPDDEPEFAKTRLRLRVLDVSSRSFAVELAGGGEPVATMAIPGSSDSAAAVAGIGQFENKIFLPRVHPDTDATLILGSHYMEALFTVRSAERRHVELEITPSEATASPQLRADGGLWFTRVDGTFLFRVPAPLAVDAKGKEHALPMSWNNETHQVTLHLPTLTEDRFPLVVDPAVETVGFEKLVSPPALSDHSLAYDESRLELVLFGGQGEAGTVTNEMWGFRAGTWARKTPAVLPPARREHVMAYDPDLKRTILFGGTDAAGGLLGDTWSWDGTSWTQIETPFELVPRGRSVMAYDTAQKQMVLFGGKSHLTTWLDLWVLSGTKWSQRAQTITGPSRLAVNGQLAEGAPGELLLLQGVEDIFDSQSDSTIYRLRYVNGGAPAWEPIPVASPDAGRRDFVWFRLSDGRLVMSGGVTKSGEALRTRFAWNGTAWQKLSDIEPRVGARIASGGGLTYSFGGSDKGRTDGRGDQFVQLSQNGETDLSASYQPSERRFPSMTFDEQRGEIVLFGGQSGERYFAETWTFSRGLWAKKTPANSPESAWTTIAYMPKKQRVVMVNGARASRLSGEDAKAIRDTWTWDGADWTKLPAQLPIRAGHVMTYDAKREHLLLFGGYDLTARNDTWIFDGSEWREVASATPPSGRFGGGLAYFPDIDRSILVGGVPDQALRVTVRDAGSWDGTNWSPEISGGNDVTFARGGVGIVYDSQRKVLVMPGGANNSAVSGDVWLRTKSRWELASAPSAFSIRRYLYGIAYDSVLKATILYGGSSTTSDFTSDTYALRLRGGGCQTGAECPSGFCTDGVCCEQSACGTCESCDGATPGRCSPVILREDPDTCASKDKRGCNQSGVCVPGLGSACTSDSDCAEGICTEGVCCNERCQGACRSCLAGKKIQGPDGVCEQAKAGENPRGACAGAATCNASGACSEGALCESEEFLVSSSGQRRSCAPFICRGQACLNRCNSARDCLAPAACSPAGVCEFRIRAAAEPFGCNVVEGEGGGGSGSTVLVIVGASVAAVLRRSVRAGRGAKATPSSNHRWTRL